MTTTATPVISEDVAPHPLEQSATGAGFPVTAANTARRTLLQFFRTPQLLFMGTIQGALFLFMFRYVFGGAIDTGSGLTYVNFLVPGFLVTTILWVGMGAAAGVAEDSSSGVYDRLRSLPIPRSAPMFGRTLADTALIAWGLVVTSALGFLIGFRTQGSIVAVLVGFGVIVLAGWAFTWVFIFMGLVSGNAQAATGLSLLVVPFSFVSSANVPIESMPGWLQPFAANQPVTVIINAVRSLMQGGTEAIGIGHTTAYWLGLSALWCGGIALVFGALAARRFARLR